MRIGTGYDVHRLVEGRELVLGGVRIVYEKGLLGHSDADVLVHAVMDALLGAAALGDIGRHFPDSDDRYLGVSSLKLLEQVRKLLEQERYVVGNIDATIIAQRPKLAEYLPTMEENIASVLGIEKNQVNFKATTEEGLGFTGAGEGIAAQAAALLISAADYADNGNAGLVYAYDEKGKQEAVRAENVDIAANYWESAMNRRDNRNNIIEIIWSELWGEENQTITDMVRTTYNLQEQDIRTYSPLALAYIGDAIYDLVIRTMLIMRGNSQVNKLHQRASNFVKAAAQKQMMEVLEPLLTPQEHSYYKRGRNAKSFTTAKNASIVEYRVATGFEALLGFLYLTGQMERLMELVKFGTSALQQGDAPIKSEIKAANKRNAGSEENI